MFEMDGAARDARTTARSTLSVQLVHLEIVRDAFGTLSFL
jgi:hypothetical protein